MRKWISREEESEFPTFDGFRDAWNFFVSMYGEDVVLETVDDVGGQKCYFCALITDWGAYDEMNRLFANGEPVIGMRYMVCRQPIQVFEDGTVHIVH